MFLNIQNLSEVFVQAQGDGIAGDCAAAQIDGRSGAAREAARPERAHRLAGLLRGCRPLRAATRQWHLAQVLSHLPAAQVPMVRYRFHP